MIDESHPHFVEPHPVDAAAEYMDVGFGIVPIAPGTKGPTAKGWNNRDQVYEDGDQRRFWLDWEEPKGEPFRTGLGLAHAYSDTMALDIDDWDVASAWLAERGVDLQALWTAPDAVQLLSGRPNRGKLIYRCGLPLATKQPPGSGLEFRCATSNGLTAQDVLPPSIHPETGKPYTWAGAGNWRELPGIPRALLDVWHSLTLKPKEQSADVVDGATGVWSPDAVWDVLNQIDPDSEYPLWIRVGMAVHEETSGSDEGFDIWVAWSAKGSKYSGTEHCRGKWDSFQGSDNPVTLHGLLAKGEPASIDAFEDLGPLPDPAIIVPTAPGKIRFTRQPADDIEQDDAPLDYFIKGVLPRSELAVLYGQSGSGKSFIMLDMAIAIALGMPWRGHRVRAARVAYVVTEGKRSFRKRLTAYKRAHDLESFTPNLGIIRDRTPGFLSAEDPRALASDIAAQGGADLIIIDTLSHAIAGGDENSSEVMSRVARLSIQLAERTGAMVLFVHHSGKDEARGQRGHSSLRAACDVELAVLLDKESKVRTLTITKSKDDADGLEFHFTLDVIDIGIDSDGDVITSCVCTEAAKPTPIEALRGLGALAMAVIEEGLAPGASTIELEPVVVEAVKRIPKTDGEDRRRSNVRRAIATLQGRGFLTLNDGVISI